MHCTLPPLLVMEVMSAVLRVTGKAEEDLSPEKGATVACAGEARLMVATVAVESIEEAICASRQMQASSGQFCSIYPTHGTTPLFKHSLVTRIGIC